MARLKETPTTLPTADFYTFAGTAQDGEDAGQAKAAALFAGIYPGWAMSQGAPADALRHG